MTVRIVELKPDASIVKRVICKNCGVTLEYVPNDVHHRLYTDYGGVSDTYYWIDCPACQHEISVR